MVVGDPDPVLTSILFRIDNSVSFGWFISFGSFMASLLYRMILRN